MTGSARLIPLNREEGQFHDLDRADHKDEPVVSSPNRKVYEAAILVDNSGLKGAEIGVISPPYTSVNRLEQQN